MTLGGNILTQIAQNLAKQKQSNTIPPDYKQAPEQEVHWSLRSACYGQSDKMFPRYHKDISYISDARKICKQCPVQEPCLNEALQYPVTDMHGVWAGLTPRQLAAEQQKRGIVPDTPTIAQIWADFAKIERPNDE